MFRRALRALFHPSDDRLEPWWGGGTTKSGALVSYRSALTSPAVFACVRAIAESVSALPCVLHRETMEASEEGKPARRRREDATGHPLYGVLRRAPNPWQTASDYWEQVVVHLQLRGNHYALILRNMMAQVIGLIPLDPGSVQPFWYRDGPDRMPAYQVTLPGLTKTYLSGEIFHVRGLPSDDGLVGLSPIAYHRETIGGALAMRDYGNRLFANDARPLGVLEHPDTLGKKAFKRLKQLWQTAHSGENQHRIGILEDGVTYKNVGLSNEDAQYLQSRQFTDLEICRLFRVPPTKIGILEKSTFNNVEQQNRHFVSDTLVGVVKRIEGAIVRDLLTDATRRYLVPDFDFDQFLRGDARTQAEVHAKGIQWGWLSPNDVRAKRGENSIGPEGDIYLSPQNMQPMADLLARIMSGDAGAGTTDGDDPGGAE